VAIVAAVAIVVLSAYLGWQPALHAQQASQFRGPTSSQPLALNADGTLLLVANPDNNSVTLFDVTNDTNKKLAEVPVGEEPNGVAILPNGSRAFVANTVSGTVTVLAINKNSPRPARFVTDIRIGTEPYALVLTPNGKKLYVANARSNNITVIDPSTARVIRTIDNVGIEPRGMAITNNGDASDDDETLLVSQFLALPVAAGKVDGEDDSKVGLVTMISTGTDTVLRTVTLHPMADTGFKAAGDAIARIAAPATPTADDFKFTTGAYPNQLNNIAIHGNFAYLPATGASPNGPVRFDVNTQSLLSAIDLTTNLDANRTINMHTFVRDQTSVPKLFNTQPWAMAAKHNTDEAYVVIAASNVVLKVNLNPTGPPTVPRNPLDNGRVQQIPVGKNPRGIVVNATDRRAYVMNYVSRDVSVIDLAGNEFVTATLRSSALPDPGTPEDVIQVGKELYYTSVGVFDAATPGGQTITGRMSNNGWGACSACHPFGLSDNVVWIFASGPRRTIPQHTDFDVNDATNQRALNWSAILDEEEDFELNIRNVSGGTGLFVVADGVTADPNVAAFTPPNTGRRQLKVRGVNSWDAIRTYIQVGIRAPISPVAKDDPDVIDGANIFQQSNCQQCHGGPQWTSAKVRFAPPPPADLVNNTQLINELQKVGTFDSQARNEVRATAAAPLGADGFAPASLLSIFAFPATFFHNGSANSLEDVLANVTHRSAGTGVDLLDDSEARRKLIRFLLSIDASTAPF
jgi:YVTN family beta-propeller protein